MVQLYLSIQQFWVQIPDKSILHLLFFSLLLVTNRQFAVTPPSIMDGGEGRAQQSGTILSLHLAAIGSNPVIFYLLPKDPTKLGLSNIYKYLNRDAGTPHNL